MILQVPSDGDFAFGQIHISHPRFIQCIDQVGKSVLYQNSGKKTGILTSFRSRVIVDRIKAL